MIRTLRRCGLSLLLLLGVMFSIMLFEPRLVSLAVPATVGDGSPSDPNIAYIGRWDTSTSGVATSYWPGAYFKTRFTGTTVQMKLGGSANLYASIDGGPDVYYAGATGTVNLTPTPLAAGTHTLRVASHSEWDSIQFEGLILDAGATTQAPTVSPNLIEFIGDSITAGLTDSKEALSDYAWLAGEQLGVEHTQIAFSGVCLVDQCKSSTDVGMVTQYFKEQTFLNTSSPAWDFSRYQAQEVVINLGTNDQGHVTNDQFQSTYITFLQKIRQKYPNAAIFVLSTFLGELVAPTQAAVQAVNAAGDTNVYSIDTTGWISYGPDYNDGAHPSDSGHAKIARLLAPYLQAKLNNPPSPLPTPGQSGTLPLPWQTQDVGSVSSVGLTGSASYQNGTFTVSGSGTDIGDPNDAFRFVYQPLHGDGTIVARVASEQNTNAWAKAGVMIRETLALGSMHAFMALTPGNGAAFQRRTTVGGSSSTTAGPSVTAPYWVKLVRSGNTFTGSVSSDGTSWTQVGSDTMPMATNIFIGLAVTAHDNTKLNTSTFDNVTITTGSAPTIGGHYTLVNQNSGMVLDNSFGGGVGNHEQQWPSNGTANQKWTISSNGSGYYTITCDSNGLALDVDSQSTSNGAAIVLETTNGGDSQLWQITSVSGGYYTIANKHSGLVLDVNGGSTSQGAAVIQWQYHNGTNQQWQLQLLN